MHSEQENETVKKQNKVEINTKVLTRQEQSEYWRRSHLLDPTVEERWSRQRKRLLIASGVCFGFGLLIGILARGNDIVETVGGILLVASPPLWVAFLSVEAFQDTRHPRVLAGQASDYLAEINYDERLTKWLAKRGIRRDDSDNDCPNYWATGDYDPGRFYRIVHSHTQYELDAMRDYGMTADEWDANRPD